MKHRLFLIALLLSLVPAAARQQQGELSGKLRAIERMQDSRTPVDSKLLAFLSDPDPTVRRRAVMAYGSLQDTPNVYRIVQLLADQNQEVRTMAAFALGQTLPLMSKQGREKWETEIIRVRIPEMIDTQGPDRESAGGRMIEETGKFCTAGGLDDLILREADRSPSAPSIPLTMAIARAAIRYVVTADGVNYLLRFIKPADNVPWQVMYALQRAGDREETRRELDHLVQIARHRNPLVRMNLATLWGKLRDERTSLDPLIRLGLFDADWRVRVNALRALSALRIEDSDEALDAFRRSFADPNMHVAMTAISTFGSIRFKDIPKSGSGAAAFTLLRKMSVNAGREYEWQIQGEAAQACAKLLGRDAAEFLPDPAGTDPFLRYELALALGESGHPGVADRLAACIRDDDALLTRGALEAFQALCGANASNGDLVARTYEIAMTALGNGDMAVRTTAAAILGDSLFLRSSSVGPLLNLLDDLSVPNDIEVLQEVIATLGKLRDARAISSLESHLQSPDRTVATAAATALASITGRSHTSAMRGSFEPLYTDYDFDYLESLPETVTVRLETLRGDVVMDLYRNMAPFTVMAILKLATQRGYYNGLLFHRVVPNFVIQGGDPRGDGWGGPGFAIRSEFVPQTFDAGAVGIASAGKDTEGSQFFIMHSPAPHLDGRYTLIGRVRSGMDVVNKIVLGDRMFGLTIMK